MNLSDSLQNVLSGAGTLNRYRLDIPSCPSPLDVEDFSGIEGLSRIYRYDIIFTTTDKHLEAAWFLCKPATLTMGGGLLESLTEQKKVHGVITHFRRISGSADQTQYLITLKPFLFLLDKQHRSHRFFVNKSVGVAAGDETSAYALEKGFEGPEPTDRLYHLGQQKDLERARRYKQIGDILSRYSYRSPAVPEINDIVPLPPAPLPAWDGKVKWLEAYNANIEPPKPDEALIERLAKDRQLNPATGRPLPASPDFEKNAAIVLLCKTGEPCPKSGYWQIARLPREGVSQNAILMFKEGDIMPADVVDIYRARPWPFSDKHEQQEQHVEWRFLTEA
ncbi:phage late control D family protein [Enterobacter hormaechei]|uniref:phage late control D family protein n=1 Tax=Enterobacter hormaechei TaxID=158836 RepID=UPI00214C1677|nr:phage late control D family protein [Enterobacter hormaechei]